MRIGKKYIIYPLLLVTILSGCGQSKEPVSNKFLDSINIELSDEPTSKNSEHTYQVSLTNSKNELVNVDSVEIILTMKSMNHKAEGKLKKTSKGVYKGKIELPMDGSWSKTIVLNQGEHTRKVNGTLIK
ncbi:FixH family protein [Gottfriedia sp. OAE603]|uniref:FixH family protein n=1 Tax=Gottfriedia sp. OAE603 TaxID=2663872 RepID=UPI00178B0186